jgi:polyisoprenoid-binding protein YceI
VKQLVEISTNEASTNDQTIRKQLPDSRRITMALPANVTTGTWTLDPSHSEIGFTVRHAGISKVRGQFTDAAATLDLAENVTDSKVNASIKTASFDSGDANRDGHVRGEDFFDVETFPEISFVSNTIVPKGDAYELQGDLTIKGITRPVALETEFNGVAVDPFGNTRAGLSAETTISRKDFGLTWNAVLEAGGVLVSDKVAINLELAFIAPAA